MMLRQYLKPHIAAMTIATILALVLGAVSALVYGLIGPAFQILSVNDPQVRLSMTTLIGPTLGAFISRLSGVNDIDAAFLWSKLPIGLIGLSAVRAILGAAQWFIWERLSETVTLNLRKDLVGAYLKSDPKRHTALESEGQSRLASAVTNDIRFLREYIVHYYGALPRELLKIMFFAATLVALSPQLLVVFCLGILPIAFVLSRLGRKLRRRSATALDGYARLSEWIQQRLLGIETIKHCGTEPAEVEKLSKLNQDLRQRFYKTARTKALIPVIMEVIAISAMSAVLYLFLDGRITGGISGGVQLSFFSTLAVLAQAAAQLGKYVNQNRESMAAIHRLEDLFAELKATKAETIGEWRQWRKAAKPVLTLEAITVRYAQNAPTPVLDCFSYQFESGHIYCIAGASGAGKSTLLNVILGLVEPASGLVKIESPDQSFIGMVPQICPLFPGTLTDNIIYPHTSGNRNDVLAVVAQTRLDELQGGIERSLVGSSSISGGQAQRVFLSRMLYHRRPIILVDEGTSALDPVLETVITQALKELADKGAIVIMSAHRLSTMMIADRILFLREGALRAEGAPEVISATPEFLAFLSESALP